MSTTIAKLNIHVGTTTAEVIKGFQTAEGAVNSFARRISGFAATFAGLFGAGSVAGMVGFGVKLAADAESAQVAFGVLTGSAEKAKSVLSDIKKLADTTPFEFPEVRSAAQQLMAYGIEAGNVVGTMRMLGDVASGMKIPLTELADLYGRNLVQGKLMTKDIREFTGRGIPLAQVLAKEMKVSVEQFMQMVEAGQIGSKEMVRGFELMTGAGGAFHNMMELQSKTLAGRWSTLKDAVSTLALKIGEALLPTMKQLVEVGFNVVNWLQGLTFETVKNTAKWTAFAAAFAYALPIMNKVVAIIWKTIQALRTLTAAQAIAAGFSGPAGWISLGVSVLVAGGAALTVSAMFDQLEKSVQKAAEKAKTMSAAMKDVTEAAKKLKEGGEKSLTFEEAQKKAQEFAEKSKKWKQEADNLSKFPQHKKLGKELEDAAKKALEVAKSYEKIAAAQKKIGNFGDSVKPFLDAAGLQFAPNPASGVRSYLDRSAEMQRKFGAMEHLVSPNVGAVTRHTSEGFSAVIQGLNATRKQDDIQKQQLKAQQDARDELKRVNERLEKIRDNPGIRLTEVSL